MLFFNIKNSLQNEVFAVLEDKVMEKMLIDVVIPTYKPGQKFLDMIDMLQKQSIKPNKIIIMNTEEKYFNKIVYGSNFLKKNPNVEVDRKSVV